MPNDEHVPGAGHEGWAHERSYDESEVLIRPRFRIRLPRRLEWAHNRGGQDWFEIWTGNQAAHPSPGSAYPHEVGEEDLVHIRENAQWQDYSLRWYMNVEGEDGDQFEWNLYIQWYGLAWDDDEDEETRQVYFIDEVRPYVDFQQPEGSNLNLSVQASYGHPNFRGHIAHMPVNFYVNVTDSGGETRRAAQRSFIIGGDGSKEHAGS